MEVTIKHAGKSQNVSLDTSKPPSAFKQTIYELTGVPVDRMKVMAKGVVLKVCIIAKYKGKSPNYLYRMILHGQSCP